MARRFPEYPIEMSYKLKRSESIQSGVRRIATQQIDRAITELDDTTVDPHATIHQVRKHCKELRGLVRLVRPALGKEYNAANDAFRDAAEPLSRLRDARSMMGTFDDLLDHFRSHVKPDAFGSIRDALSRRLNKITDDEIKQQFAGVRKKLVVSRKRVTDWKLSETGFNALDDGVAKTHHRAADCLKNALYDPETEVIHQLRKHVKYHSYHARLLRDIWPAVLNPYAAALKEIGELLGHDHDLAVLNETILTSQDEFGAAADVEAFIGLLQQRREQNSAAAMAEAQAAFAEPTEVLIKRLKALWKLW